MASKITTIFALDMTRPLTHQYVKGAPGGASEYQYYRLLEVLSNTQDFRVQCFNTNHWPQEADKVQYYPFSLFADAVAAHIAATGEPPVVLVQRFWPLMGTPISDCLSQLPRVFLWAHDGCPESSFNFFGNANDDAMHRTISSWPGVNYITVSHKQRQDFIDQAHINPRYRHFLTDRIHVIHNILYADELDVSQVVPDPVSQLTNLVYASSWHKGARDVVELFEQLLVRDPTLRLTLLEPGYDGNCFDALKDELRTKFSDAQLQVLPALKRNELAAVMANALLVFSAPFGETFGCVFAESLLLGTPVLVNYRSGAVEEIVRSGNVVNYKDVDSTFAAIQRIRERRHTHKTTLADEFQLPFLKQRWIDVLTAPAPTPLNH